MPTTIQDIARELDLSVATVSRSLRHDPVIRPETRARVNEAALKLGYRVRSADRGRAEAETTHHSLGVLLQIDGAPRRDNNEILVQMLEGISAEADAAEAVLNLHSVGFADRGKMATNAGMIPRMIRERVCSACIIQGTQDPEDVATLASLMPVVTLSRLYPNILTAAVVQDNMNGISRLVERLAKLGHKRLAWVPEYLSLSASSQFEERRAGFLLGCQRGDLALDEQQLYSLNLYDAAAKIDGKALVEAVREQKVTAFVCAGDHLAQKVAQILLEAGFEIPRDVSITGFDSAFPTLPNGRALTTVDPHFYKMGRLAVRLAIQCLEHPDEQSERRFVAGTLLEGESIAPPPVPR